MRSVAKRIGLAHGVKQLVWEMKRERKCQRLMAVKAGKARSGARGGGEGEGEGESEGEDEGMGEGEGEGGGEAARDLAICSGCNVPTISDTEHTCTKCGRHNHPWCGIEADGMHM